MQLVKVMDIFKGPDVKYNPVSYKELKKTADRLVKRSRRMLRGSTRRCAPWGRSTISASVTLARSAVSRIQRSCWACPIQPLPP